MIQRHAVLLAALVSAVQGCAEAPTLDEAPPPTRPEEALRQAAAVSSAAVVLDLAHDLLTPDAAALLALEGNPRLRALRSRRGLIGVELVAAGMLPNPRLAVAVGAPIGGKEGNQVSINGEASWEITALLGRDAARQSAREEVASVDLEVAWQEWVVAQAARLHAIQVVSLARRVEVARQIERTWAARLDAQQRALAVGAATVLDVTAARDAIHAARLDALALARDLADARSRLVEDLGVPAGTAIQLDSGWVPSSARPPLQALLDRLPRRLDVLAFEHGQRSHEAGLQRELARRFPPVELGVFAQRDPDRVGAVGMSVSFGLPFFSRNQAAVLLESEASVQAGFDHDAALASARAEVTRLAEALQLVDQQILAAQAATECAVALGDLSARAARTGALSGLSAVEAQLSADRALLRQLELEHARAELLAAFCAAAGP
jgi:outer membrane protein, heavy metal efflux system